MKTIRHGETIRFAGNPFTDDSALVQAAVDASGIGRGPKETNMRFVRQSPIRHLLFQSHHR